MKENTKAAHDEDEDEDEDEESEDATPTTKKPASGDEAPDDEDEDGDYDDDSEDDDEEPVHKGAGEEVAVVDGDAVMDAIRENVDEAVSKAVEAALPALIEAFLTDADVLGKQRSMIRGAVNKSVAAHLTGLTEVADRLEKALSGGEVIAKGIADATDEAARTTPALKETAEVLEKSLGTSPAAPKPVDVDALVAEAKELQLEKGVTVPILGDFLSLDIQGRHDPENIAALRSSVDHAKSHSH